MSGNGSGGAGTSNGGVFGAGIKRKEDPRLLLGNGRYISDIKLHGMLSAVVIRSPHAHAEILGIDKSRAEADPRVHAVVTFEDLPEGIAPMACIDAEETTKPFYQQLLATKKVRYVGEPVVILVADDRYQAEDLAHLVEIDYRPLEAVVDPEAAIRADAPILHDETNVCEVLDMATGDAKAAIDAAPHRLAGRFATQRYAGVPMETRGSIADWDPRTQSVTLWCSTQIPNSVKNDVQSRMGLPEANVRVVVPDVGGAFGVKLQTYPEEIILCLLARRLSRPVKWIEDRWEHFVSTSHGREQFHEIEVGFDGDGRIAGMRDRCVTNTGAYLQRLTLVEPFIGPAMMAGPYEIPNFEATSIVVMTNKTPMNPFRGVGHVQAAFTMERVIDKIARHLGLDPAEVRRRNMLAPDKFPYARGFANVLAGEIVYDSGDYVKALDRALEISGYDAFREEQARAREEGRLLGIGIGAFVEETGLGPYEMGIVRLEPSGRATVMTGSCTSGQGHGTTLSQIAADSLGLTVDDIDVIYGDTDQVRWGVGTYASRSAVVGGTAIRNAAEMVRDKVIQVAADMLEAEPGDIELSDGMVGVVGSPGSRRLPIGEIAAAVAPGKPLAEGIETYGIEATDVFHPPDNTFAYGIHVAKVEVDPETGVVKVLELHVVNDSGTVVNPLILDGQVHGGASLGIGGALLEEIEYDEAGQPTNPNFMDYLLPSFDDVPRIEVEHMVTRSPHNPDGMKGGGEGGAVGAPPAVVNAVCDAIAPAEIDSTPLTPMAVFSAMAEAGIAQSITSSGA